MAPPTKLIHQHPSPESSKVKDFAYLYATPRGFGFLTLSELAQGAKKMRAQGLTNIVKTCRNIENKVQHVHVAC